MTHTSGNTSDGTDELYYAGIRELVGMTTSKQISARELLEVHLRRIAAVNDRVNAVVSLDAAAAHTEAQRIDDELVKNGPVGPLHGLPAAFKDTHATAGMRTTYGSPIYADNVPEQDDLVVARIRAAGAVGIGKTNVPEFAAGSHTFNPIFGVTRNPHALGRSAGGSSGGAAAALAAGMVPVAEGSDFGGSLRNPASFCNVVGLRPSAGRVPESPRARFWDTMNVMGPMGRSVDDVAVLLSAISGPEHGIPNCRPEPGAGFGQVDMAEPHALRIAVSPDLGMGLPIEPDVAAIIEQQAETIAGLGCMVEDACLDFTGGEDAFRTVRAWTFAAKFADFLASRPEDLKASVRWNAEQGLQLSGADLARADAHRMQLFARTTEFFDTFDALILPVSPVPPFDVDWEYPETINGEQQDTYLDWMRSAYLVSTTGAPALSLPAGFTPEGLPVGIQIVAGPGCEAKLLAISYLLEHANPIGRRRPNL